MNTSNPRLYETDFYGWLQNQAQYLRAGSFASLDLENLIEEIESMGKSHQRALESRLEVLLMHLLKWKFQPALRGASWMFAIKEQRIRLADHIQRNPSLQSRIPEALESAYRYAVFGASRETGMDACAFPAQCPWTFAQTMDADFWPEPEQGKV